MIKSKSWEISAWNPKDSVMLQAVSDNKERRWKWVRERDLEYPGVIYPSRSHT
jgi:hypothetical protein